MKDKSYKGITPNKSQRRPEAQKPSPPKKVIQPKKQNYRPQGR